MNNKEFQKKYNELVKQRPEYLYQRYMGKITKYKKLDENTYISCSEVGMIFKKDKHLLLGKCSNNIIDLIEVGDIVQIGVVTTFIFALEDKENLEYFKELYKNDQDTILSILTKEQFEQNSYKIEE